MNFIQSPPNHYPGSQDSTIEIFRTRNFSVNTNASSPPGYHAERAPPRYQEATEAEAGEHDTEEGARKARKVRWIRIASSIFIVTTVALIVAGVVGKINGMEADQGLGKQDEESSETASGITIFPQETADVAEIKLPTTAHETGLPTPGAAVEDPADESESTPSESDGSKPSSALQLPLDQFGLSFREQEVKEEGKASACGIARRAGISESSDDGTLYVLDGERLAECFTSGSLMRRLKNYEDQCKGDCSVAKLAEEPMIDEWEWDSG